MPFSKYQQLKIAGNVLDETITDMGNSWNVTLQTVKGVCKGEITSARIEQNISEKIDEAERVYDKHRQEKQKTSV
jgi:hypothetical protein